MPSSPISPPRLIPLLLPILLPLVLITPVKSINFIPVPNATHDVTYGADASWPIHHFSYVDNPSSSLSKSSVRGRIWSALSSGTGGEEDKPNPLGPSPSSVYATHMNGCANTYSKSMCEGNERSRMEMNLEQPARMKNYTELGFAKTM